MTHNLHGTLQTLTTKSGVSGRYYSLPALEAAGVGGISRLPVSIRIVLESVLRNCDGKKVTEEHVRQLANWAPNAAAHRGNSVHRRARRAAGLHRRAALVRPRRDARRRAARGQEPQGHRAAGAGRSGRRSLGTGRLLRHEERARPQHESRVSAQRRALQVHEMGHAGIRYIQGRAAGRRHRASGQPRISGARRAPEGRHLLSRYAGRHRFAYDDDQRHRRRRVGRRRHRGRSRHAGPAAVHADAGRRRRALQRPAQRRRDGDRPGADGDGALAQGQGRRQICRVFRRGCGIAFGPGSRDARQHVARVWRDDGLFRGRRQDDRVSDQHRKDAGRDRSGRDVLPRPGPLWHAGGRHDRLFADGRARPVDGHCQSGRTEAPAGSHRAAENADLVRDAFLQAGRRERLRPIGGQACPALSGLRRDCTGTTLERRRAAPAEQRPAAERGRDGRQPTNAGSRKRARAKAARHRQRRHPDRGDHVVHQYVESGRVARRGPAREESGGEGTDGQATHQDFARARIAGGHRIPDQIGAAARAREAQLLPGRLRLHDLHRQLGTARSFDRGSDHQERSGVRGGPLGQSQLRGAHPSEHQGELPRFAAAGRRLRDRRSRQHRLQLPSPSVPAATASRSFCATCGRRRRKSAR